MVIFISRFFIFKLVVYFLQFCIYLKCELVPNSQCCDQLGFTFLLFGMKSYYYYYLIIWDKYILTNAQIIISKDGEL